MGDNRNYSEATKAALFALSVSCYEPQCQQPTVTVFVDDPDKNVQIAHIRAVKPNGPRYDPPGQPSMTPEERNAFPNLILLCQRHHRLVDNKVNERIYTVDLLLDWKELAERDIRAKVDGLDRLTEERLNVMLTTAAQNTKVEIDGAITKFKNVSESAAELLRALFEKIESQYLDTETIALLSDAAYRLSHLQDTAGLLHASAQRLGNFEDSVGLLAHAARELEHLQDTAGMLSTAAGNLADYDVNGSSRRLTQFIEGYQWIPDVPASIESAADVAIARIERRVEAIDVGEPPVIVDDGQRWKWGLWGFALGVVAVFLTVAILALSHKL
ncbi:hypothetical protein AB0383_35385 [Amycolatopsis sp. NPDC051373]|uniref:hypothetical protein n=1 Tax=Amycolatopsis sp. NPDC051373 TaxID=3155801 RepID=UPI00344D7528